MSNMFDKMPKELKEEIDERLNDDAEIIITMGSNGETWFIIKEKNLDNWISVFEWYEGEETFNRINICDNAYEIIKKMMKEE